MQSGSPEAVEGRDFEVGPGVVRAARGRPYERQPDDPLYRPLRIFSLDPTVSQLEGAVAEVEVPYEPLGPGPVGALFEVDDADSVQRTHWGRADLDDSAVLLRNGIAPSVTNPLFHQQMVYAVCATVYHAFRQALGRHVSWGFEANRGEAEQRDRLRVLPHAFEGRNAFYDREAGELRFGYFQAEDDATGRTPPGGVVFTCLSHDIVAHEVTHALLDGLRAHFCRPTGPDVLGFHEGFADIVAVLRHFGHRDLVLAAIRRTEGRPEGSGLLTGIAHQFSQSRGSTQPLRTAFESMAAGCTEPKPYAKDQEPHEIGEVLVQAIFEAWTTVFNRKVEPYLPGRPSVPTRPPGQQAGAGVPGHLHPGHRLLPAGGHRPGRIPAGLDHR